MSPVVASFISAAVSALLAGFGTYWTARRNLQLKFDDSLRDLRIDAYGDLWQSLESLAKYGRPHPLTVSDATTLLSELRKWYFHTGGLVLSTSARHDYFRLLDGLELVIAVSREDVTSADDEYLRVLGSRLRTAMTRDVGTRRTFVFRGDAEPKARLERRTFVDSEDTSRTLVLSTRPRLALARRLRRVLSRVVPREPRIDQRERTVTRWDPQRRAFEVRAQAGEAKGEARLFLIEDDELVEGPAGWRRGHDAPPARSVVWLDADSGSRPMPADRGRTPGDGMDVAPR